MVGTNEAIYSSTCIRTIKYYRLLESLLRDKVAEELCKMYSSLFGLNTVIFRYFNVYGERQPIKGQYAPVVGIFQRQVANKEPMTIVGDGLQRRDFTHVSDVVRANILASKSDNSDIFGEVINIGTGTNINMIEQ